MKQINRTRELALALIILLSGYSQITAQTCIDPVNVIYGLTNAGFIYPITVSTGVVGPQLNPAYTGNAPNAANGIGYNILNGKFYYFKRDPGGTFPEFVSYDPATNAVVILAAIPTTFSVYVGCVNKAGTAYYCWDSNASLFYYNIALNTWTKITSTIVDQSGTDVSAVIRTHGSGDVTIDGNGNLLMLPASNAKYALYRLLAPLPTTTQASVTVQGIIAPSNPPAKFVGIALNSTGQILLNTASPSNQIYRLNSNLTFTLISTLSFSMGDLTSCNFPITLLTSGIKNFQVNLRNNSVLLSWDNDNQTTTGYFIEHSTNSTQWEEIGFVSNAKNGSLKSSCFNHTKPVIGKNYYRVRVGELNGEKKYSSVKEVTLDDKATFALWPNPVQNNLWIKNSHNTITTCKAILADQSGRNIAEFMLAPGQNTLNMAALTPGNYLVRIHLPNGEILNYKIVKQ